MTRTLLIDADVTAYQAAASVEVATDWGEGFWTWHCDEDAVKRVVKEQIEKTMDNLKGTEYKLCLTDTIGNFRKQILPTYKGNRASTKRPLLLQHIKQWMIDELDAYYRPTLEGDDCLGILATMKGGGERIIVSIDKDMKTIPTLVCRDVSTCEVVDVSESEANYWHLYQTLTGDTTDGYSGCPKIGAKGAEKLLSDFYVEGHFDVPAAWEAIVTAFTKAGLNETAALQQARVARILRASDYDFKNKEPILWSPPRL